MTETEWRWADPAGQQRLVRTDELRAALAGGVLAPNTPVWRPGWTEWKPAHDVPELTTSALAAANGVVPNIPPPPLAVVAVQAAFESTGSHMIPVETHKIEEPPPPPRYVPAPTRAQAGMFHTPSHPVRVPANLTPPAPESKPQIPPPPASAPKLPPEPARAKGPPAPLSSPKLPPTPDSKAKLPPTSDSKPKLPPSPDSKPASDRHHEKIAARTPQPPVAVPKPGGLSQLVRSSATPPPPRVSSLPPPPPRASSMPPAPKSRKPPPPKPENIEELSGSMLLDANSSQNADAIEELSGSILLDANASQPVTVQPVTVQPVNVVPAVNALDELSDSILPTVPGAMTAITREQAAAAPHASQPSHPTHDAPAVERVAAVTAPASEELSGSFLLDAGSTGALPDVDSESAIRVTSPFQAQPAPFGAYPAPLPAAGEPPRIAEPAPQAPPPAAEPISPWAMPLGPASVPPPVSLATTQMQWGPPPAEERITVPRVTQPGDPTPEERGDRTSAATAHAGATLMGVPPPPDLIARSPDSAIPPPPTTSLSTVPLPPVSKSPLPLVTQPVRPYVPSTDSVPPTPERSDARLHDFRAIAPDSRVKYVLGGLGVVGAFVLLGAVGLVIGLARKKPGEEPSAAASASSAASANAASSSASPSSATLASPAAAAPGGTSLGGACALGGTAHVIAPRAVVQSGVEVQVVGDRVALGFASAPKNGIAVALDPTTLAATQTARVKAPDSIRRLVPIPTARGLAGVADVERAGDALAGRRTMSADPPFDLGLGGGGVAWAPIKSRSLETLWPLDGDAPIEAVRAAPLDPASADAGYALAFRRGASVFAGVVTGASGALKPKGPLVRVDGLGPQVGSPAVAAQDGAVLVAWADRASPSDPWSVRWMRFAPGDAAAEAKPFAPGEGGLGEHVMSPAIAPAGQGRFVLAWTEGPVSSHQVRAQTLSSAGSLVGKPFAVSDPGVNAGQAQLAILPDGHGVVAYLASTESGAKAAYQVVATPIACP